MMMKTMIILNQHMAIAIIHHETVESDDHD